MIAGSRVAPATLERLARRIQAAEPGSTVDVRLPFTGGTLGGIPRCGADDIATAAHSARAALPAWAGLPVERRARPVLRLHDLLLERREELLDIIQLESGKARRDAFEELADCALAARYYGYHAAAHLRTRRRRGALPGLTLTRVRYAPVGLVGIISPWNYPLALSVSDAIPALLAGNAVLLKPDVQASFTALYAAELFEEAGLPPALFQVVTGEGPELGPPLIDAVDYVAFTGSVATGRIVARRAADRLIGCSLELGGKNPLIVLADANLERALAGALRGCFSNAGQLCLSMERLLVHRSVVEPFLERFVASARALRLEASLDPEVDMGSLLSPAQLEKVQTHVRDALEGGAEVLAGGRARPDVGPYFFEPTVLAGVTPAMTLHAQETFGPVVSVFPFEEEEEAVALANDTPYGLNASIWTRDRRRGARLAARVQAGSVNVNDAYAAAWGSLDAPMGGFKGSGLGRRHGAEGIRRFTQAQTIAVHRGPPLAAPGRMSQARFQRLVVRLLKAVRRVPGLR